jgi:hypothetical protein
MRRFIGSLLLLVGLAGSATAATYHLNADGTGDFATIAEAIAAVAPGDSILLAAGLYLGAGNTQLDYGGKDIVIAGAGPEATILDCMDSGVPVLRIDSGETRAAVLRDLTLRNNYHFYEPTGVIIDGASPSFFAVHLEGFGGDNFYSGVGAINCANSSALLQDVEVRACYGRGGIRVSGAVELERVLVENCSAGEYGSGGGIKAGGSATLREVTVRNCGSFNGMGGGVVCGGNVVFEDCRFEANAASSEVGYTETGGGGVACNGGTPVLRRCVFTENWARDGGGGLGVYDGSAPLLEDVLFVDNASDIGGTIVIDEATATLRRVTIVGSRYMEDWDTYDGPSAIHCIGSSPVIEQVIVAFSEEGVGLWADTTSNPLLTCSDLFGNPGGNYGGVLADQTGLNGNISADPLFCDAPGGEYTLDAISPCLPWNNDCHEQMGAFGWGCGVTAAEEAAPGAFGFAPPQPNPFNPKTTLRFALPRAASVDLAIFDVNGRRVARLLAGEPMPTGNHAVNWEGRDEAGRALASGVYFARFAAGGFTAEQKLVLLR